MRETLDDHGLNESSLVPLLLLLNVFSIYIKNVLLTVNKEFPNMLPKFMYSQ